MSNSAYQDEYQRREAQQRPPSTDRSASWDSQSPSVPLPQATPILHPKALEARSTAPLSPGIDVLSLLKKDDDRRLFSPSPAPTYRTSAASPPPPVHLRRSSSLRPPLPPLPPPSRQNSMTSPLSVTNLAFQQHQPTAPAFGAAPLDEEEEEEALESPADGSLGRWTIMSSATGRSRSGSEAQSFMSAFGDVSGMEGMTDAEIAQHHFRLAQQHLEAAQRLAMAAAARTSRPSPSAPSPAPASVSLQPHLSIPQQLASHRDDDLESSIDPSESVSVRSPRSFGSGSTAMPTTYEEPEVVTSEFGRLEISEGAVGTGYDPRRSRSLSSLHPSSQQLAPLSSPSSGYPASTRSAPVRASSISKHPAQDMAPAHPPLPAQRRPSNPPLPSSTPQPGPTPAQAYARAQQELGMQDDDLVGSSDGGHGEGPGGERARDYFFDDAASEYGGDESTFSHVMNATLPPYDLGYGGGGRAGEAVPPVPPLPARFAAEAAAAAAHPARPRASAPPASAGEPFHGFRPRLAPAPPSSASFTSSTSGPRTVVNAPSPYAAHPHPFNTPPPASLPPPQSFPAPQFSTAHLVPHSYILSPTGQPIPVYASPSALPISPSAPPPGRGTLAVHAQPLQFDHHTLPYSHALAGARPPPTPVPAPAYTAQQQHPSPVYSPARQQQTLHPSHSTASFTPSFNSASSSSSTTNLAPHHPHVSFRSTSRAPSISNFSDSSSGSKDTTATSSTGMKGRMASLRAKMKSTSSPSLAAGAGEGPRVRFQSPGPEGAKQRALMGGVGEVMDEKGSGKSGGGGGEGGTDAEKQRKGLQMSMSMLL